MQGLTSVFLVFRFTTTITLQIENIRFRMTYLQYTIDNMVPVGNFYYTGGKTCGF
jgi:hypothetical protein